MRTFLILASVVGGCSHSNGGMARETRARAEATCLPPGLEHATPREVYRLPAGCTFTNAGSLAAPVVLRTAEELAAALACTGAAAPPIDFAANDLYVSRYSMSPAFAGIEPYDDGANVTVVTRFRQPCPNDPMPMPMGAIVAYRVPKSGPRAVREANCTLPLDCP